MKKIMFFMMATCAIFVMSSCNNQEPVSESHFEKVKEQQEMKKLINALDAYNASYFGESVVGTDQMAVTRGKGGFWKRLRMVWADAVGAFIGASLGPWGAIGGGAACSLFAASMENSMESSAPTRGHIVEPVDGITISVSALENTVLTSNLYMCADSVGYYHNKILMDLYEPGLYGSSISDKVDSIFVQAENNSFADRGTTTNNQLLETIQYSQLSSNYSSFMEEDSFDNFVSEYLSLYSCDDDEMAFLKNVIRHLGMIAVSENDGSYATGVLSTISNSDISTEAKKRLGEAVITGNASALLWDIQ